MAREIARAVRSYSGDALTSTDVMRAIERTMDDRGDSHGTHNVVTRLGGRVAMRVSIAPITAEANWWADEEIELSRRACDSGLGLRAIWHGVVDTPDGGRYVSCWPWAICAMKRTRALARRGVTRMPFGAEICAALRLASRLYVMLDMKLSNVVFSSARRSDVRLIDFDPLFVRDASRAPQAAARFTAVQMLLIDLSALCVGARVFSLADIRRAVARPGATVEELGGALARAAGDVMRAYDDAFAAMLALILARYVSVPLEMREPDAGRVRYEPGFAEALLRAALCACYARAGLAAAHAALDALGGPCVGGREHGDVDVATALSAEKGSPRVVVDGTGDDERHEVAQAAELAPVDEVRRRYAVNDHGAHGLADAPSLEVERRALVGAERTDDARDFGAACARARAYVA